MGYHSVYHIQCVEHVLEDARHYKYVPMTLRSYSPSPLYRLVRGGPQGISIPWKERGVWPDWTLSNLKNEALNYMRYGQDFSGQSALCEQPR